MKQSEKEVRIYGMDGKLISIAITAKTAYISGKITGLTDLNKPKFEAAEALLRSYGYKVINPHTICNDIHPGAEWNVFMKRCIKHLPDADIVFLLDDWQASDGSVIESVTAHQLGIQVVFLESYKFEQTEQVA